MPRFGAFFIALVVTLCACELRVSISSTAPDLTVESGDLARRSP